VTIIGPDGKTYTAAYTMEKQPNGFWRSFEAVEFATLEWVDWFNRRRLLEPIGNIPPAEAGQNHYAVMDKVAMAA
jgi:putative transposase